MKSPFLVLATLLVHLYGTEGKHWAFIVAGAKGYDNYRHQANACHAYHIMLKHGIPHENIITMMYDDIAYNPRNPFQGNIINEAGGPNVYEGVRIDYRGTDVTADNFLKVLQGKATNAGSGRVIESGPEDHIFVYYSDHGGRRFLFFPYGDVLHASHLDDAINNMHSANRYAKMVIYVEACHSGSMFYHRLSSKRNVYVMTAADPWESSYSCCYDPTRHTFLGDQFSGHWMKDTETHDVSRERLGEQYSNVRRGVQLSHPTLYGDVDGMRDMMVGDFQGMTHVLSKVSKRRNDETDLVPAWDVSRQLLLKELEISNTTEGLLRVLHQLEAEDRMRSKTQENLEMIAMKVSGDEGVLKMQKTNVLTDDVNLDQCYEASVDEYLRTCRLPLHGDSEYILKDVFVFENLCSKGVSANVIKDTIRHVCSE